MDSLGAIESTHALYVSRLTTANVNKLNSFWQGYYNELLKPLLEYNDALTQRQLTKLINEITAIVSENMGAMHSQLMLDFEEFAEYETGFQAKAIGAVTAESVAIPATAQVVAAAIESPISLGKAGAVSLESWLKDIEQKQRETIANEVRLGYANGVSNAELVRNIIGTKAEKYTDGIVDMSRRSAVALVRTTTNHYASTAKKVIAEQNKNIVIGHRIIATLDKRTSPICRSKDQKEYIYSKKQKKEYPPFHVNCRSSYTLIIKGYNRDPLGKRASKGVEIVDGKQKPDPKQVSSATQYYNWLKGQPVAFQDDILGKTKGAIFRNSGISPEKFKNLLVDRMGKELTIKQLAEKDETIRKYLSKM